MSIEIEICNNREFIRENILDLPELGEAMRNAAAEEWSVRAFGEILAIEGADMDPINPRGQRQMYHGWNGAQGWMRRGIGWGTFDTLTPARVEAIDTALEALTNRINAEYAAQWPDEAESLLEDRAERFERIGDGDGGEYLTAHWIGGGQTLFRCLREVNEWIDAH